MMTAGTASGVGVVYTDTTIARFMIEEALRAWLQVHPAVGKENADEFLQGEWDLERALRVLRILRKASFLDPAVGEGVFIHEYIVYVKQIHARYGEPLTADWIPEYLTGYEIDQAVMQGLQPNPWGGKIRFQDYLQADSEPPDLIVANPPYVRQELIDRAYKTHIYAVIREKWPTYPLNKRMDLYAYFVLKGLSELKPAGIGTFIIPSTWLDNDYGLALRRLVTEAVELVSITDSRRRHFSVDVNTVIVTFRKAQPGKSLLVRVDKVEKRLPVKPLKDLDLPWGGWLLRSPDWVRDVLPKKVFRPLDTCFQIKTGIITGHNARYYGPPNGRGEPAIKSPREVTSILWQEKDATHWVQNKGVPYRVKRATFLWPDLRGSRHFTVWNRHHLAFEHTFYGLEPRRGDETIWALILNSTWIWLMVEIFGRHSLGGGALRLVKSGLGKLPIPQVSGQSIPSGLDNFLTRPILNGAEELEQPDRRRLDRWLFQSLGLEHYLDQLYEDTHRLMENRINKATIRI